MVKYFYIYIYINLYVFYFLSLQLRSLRSMFIHVLKLLLYTLLIYTSLQLFLLMLSIQYLMDVFKINAHLFFPFSNYFSY